jgi:hypothetical protein
MIKIVYTPVWFHGNEILIDLISVVVLSLLLIFTYKCFRIDKTNKNYLFAAIAFALLDLSFIFKILTNFTIYYATNITRHIGPVTLTFHGFKETDTLFFFGYLAYRLLTLYGLYLLYVVYKEKNFGVTQLFVIYLITVLTFFSQESYDVFHFTSFVLLLLITWNYFIIHKVNRKRTTMLLTLSFLLITISHMLCLSIEYMSFIYIIAEVVQLAGYALLLTVYIMVLKNGKKTSKK